MFSLLAEDLGGAGRPESLSCRFRPRSLTLCAVVIGPDVDPFVGRGHPREKKQPVKGETARRASIIGAQRSMTVPIVPA